MNTLLKKIRHVLYRGLKEQPWIPVLRILLGLVFITSAVTKLLNQTDFLSIVAGTNFLPGNLSAVYALLLPWLELATGLLLLFAKYVKLAALVSTLLVCTFIVFNLVVIFRYPESGLCGCFGQMVPMGHNTSLAMDVLMLLSGLILLVFKTGPVPGRDNTPPFMFFKMIKTGLYPVLSRSFIILSLTAFIWSSFTISVQAEIRPSKEDASISRSDDRISPDTAVWVNSKVSNTLAAGKKAFIYFYNEGCPYCDKQNLVMETLEPQYSSSIDFIRISAFDEPEIAGKYNVTSVPSLFLISGYDNDGNYQYQRFNGLAPEETLKPAFQGMISGKQSGPSSAAAVEEYCVGQTIDSFDVYAKDFNPVASKWRMEYGRVYSLRISGEFSLWNTDGIPRGDQSVDSLFRFDFDKEEPLAIWSQLWINGYSLADWMKKDLGREINMQDYSNYHLYAVNIIGRGEPFTFRINDGGSYDDNGGKVHVRICLTDKTGTPEGTTTISSFVGGSCASGGPPEAYVSVVTPNPTVVDYHTPSGWKYTLVISGIFSLWDSTGNTAGADALYEYNQSTNAPGRLFSNFMINDKSLNDWLSATGKQIEYNPKHVYTLDMVGDGKSVKFVYQDSYYLDNYGHISVYFCERTSGTSPGTAPTPSDTDIWGVNAGCPNQQLESINVNSANSSNVSSSTVLQSGKVYPLRISGAFSLWNPDGVPRGDQSVDGLFHYNQDSGKPIEVWSQLWINDKPLADWLKTSLGRDLTLSDYNSSHVYSLNITGSGQPLNFRIYDSGAYNDNGGIVTVRICASTGSGSSTTPTVSPTATPSDTDIWGTTTSCSNQELESVNVMANNRNNISSRTVLQSGKVYPLRISGAFSLWNADGIPRGDYSVDALFHYNQDTGKPIEVWTQLWINDKPLADWLKASLGRDVSLGDYYQNHIYSVNITGNGQPLNLRIYDSGSYDDNGGGVTVHICASTGSGSSTTPTVSPTATPSDTDIWGTTSSCPNQELESVNVKAENFNNVSSRTVLQSGKVYPLRISGAFSLWNADGVPRGDQSVDALFHYNQDTSKPIEVWTQLWINDKPLAEWLKASLGRDVALGDFASNHIYSLNITGSGQPLNFRIYDSGAYNDNGGIVTVRICASTGSGPGVSPAPSTSPSPSGSPAGTPAAAASCPNQQLESINVNAGNSSNVSSSTILQSGKVYPLRISGAFSLWNADGVPRGDQSVDALFHYNQDTGKPIEVWTQLWINDKPLAEWLKASLGRDVALGDFASNHIYSLNITGSGQPLNFRIYDSGSYADNGGGVNVRICASTGSGPGISPTPSTTTSPPTTMPGAPVPGANPSQEPASVTRMTLEAGKRKVTSGSQVTVPVWLSRAENVANTNFEISYNAAIASPEGNPAKGNLLDDALFSANPKESGIIRIGFAQTAGISGTGTVAYITLTALGKPGDRTPLTLSVTKINDPGGKDLSIDLIHGEIVIVTPEGVLPGDCDGDGRLTALDALCALEMSVKIRPEKLSLDIDVDRQITSRDSVLILQRIFIR
jgi:putative oxidoreductase